jgi:hypothetical protein
VFILDRMLVGSLKFVLGKIVDAANAEMNDEGALREELLAAQVRHELGELNDEELDGIERAIVRRLGEIRQARREARSGVTEGYRVTGIEATVETDDTHEKR